MSRPWDQWENPGYIGPEGTTIGCRLPREYDGGPTNPPSSRHSVHMWACCPPQDNLNFSWAPSDGGKWDAWFYFPDGFPEGLYIATCIHKRDPRAACTFDDWDTEDCQYLQVVSEDLSFGTAPEPGFLLGLLACTLFLIILRRARTRVS